eukprot:tig00000404_g389.t1
MALNPQIMQAATPAGTTGLPVPYVGELFILQRKGVELAVDGFLASGQKFKPSSIRGIVYMSTFRIVFVAARSNQAFESFEIPFVYIYNEMFNQPILGANNLSGNVQAVMGGGLQGMAKFKIYFMEGGVGTLLPLFYSLMAQAHQRLPPREDAAMVNAVGTGQLVRQAYVDPSDPSVLYITQPVSQPNTQYSPPSQYPQHQFATQAGSGSSTAPSAPPAPQ